jgi:hypothetical protein
MTELTPSQIEERNRASWQWRCLAELREMRGARLVPSTEGAILMQAFHKQRARVFPRVSGQGWINADGNVLCNMWDGDGVLRTNWIVAYSVQDFTNGWRVLADELHLSDKDRVELFNHVRGWIGRDYRVSIPLSASDKGG